MGAHDAVPIYFLPVDSLDLLAEAHVLLAQWLQVVVSAVLPLGRPDAVVAGLRVFWMVLVLRAGLLAFVEIRVLLEDVLHIDLRDVPVGPMPPLVHDLGHSQATLDFVRSHRRVFVGDSTKRAHLVALADVRRVIWLLRLYGR